MNLAMINIVHLVELFSVGAVVLTTIYIMQHRLTQAHMLLRIGLALVCGGSVLEFYSVLQQQACDSLAYSGVIENLGQAAVYVWAATSKRLWRIMGRIEHMQKGKPL